ncbi:MAG: flagellar filament capping protein FliD [Gammaproteobacteria bacterium]|nr:flagellar filament capping protein FliD [Gammaproteobacteria bacterium]
MISAPGLGTGLDIAGIVETLVAAERAPQDNRLNRLESRATAKLSAYGELKSALADLRTALEGINGDDFRRRSTTTARDDLATATAAPGAPLGNFSVEVVSLASAHRLTSKAFADQDTVIDDGTLDITVNGETMSLTIDASNYTVAGIRDAVNDAEDNPGVTATIITADDGVHLVFSANEAGAANELEVDGQGGDLKDLDYNPSKKRMTEQSPAQDAEITVDGFTIFSASNQVSGAVEGLTFNLLVADPGTEFEIAVNEDLEAAKVTVEDFVETWNNAQDIMRRLTSYDSANEVASELLGDSLTRSIRDALRREISAVVGSGDISMLSDVGIQTEINGDLTLDAAKLDAALSEDSGALIDLFTGAGGMATRVDSLLAPHLDAGGTFATREDSLQQELDDVADRRDLLDLRIDKVRLRLQDQFAAMDALVAQLNNTGSFLIQQLSQLG